MSRVTRQRSAVNFQFTISETPEVSLADVRVKVQNAITRIRYNETAPFQSVGLAFASLPDLSSRENVSIHTLDYYPLANRPGVITQDYYQINTFFTEIGKFNVTDMFIKKGTGLDVPLYWEHQIPITTDLFIQSGSDIIVLDRNFDPVDPEDYLVWEGSTYWSVFHNFKHEYDGLTGDYTSYYVSYPLWDGTRSTQREHVELLSPTPRFRLAVEDDYDGFTLPDDVPLYEVQNDGDRFLVTIYYDIVGNSPMNDIYVSPTPYVYAYRPEAIHEIGPLFPAALSQDDPWFPLLTNGNFFASNNEYLIAEYSQQPFIPYQPYKREIYDEAIILERTLIKTQKQNLYVDATAGFHLELLIFDRNENIKYAASTDTTQEYYVDAVGEYTSIPYDHEGFESVNSEDGLIQISYSLIELDDIIQANYYYIEADFEYTQVNMNPIYVPEIAGKSVVLYMVPYSSQTITMYHLILDEEDQIEDSNGIPDSVAVPGPTNVSHGTVLVGRGYTGSVDATWYIEITQSNSTPGDITDAQYRFKKGFTGAWTAATSMITGWVTLGSGVQIKFEPGTGGQDFTAGDTWTVEVQSNDIGLTDDIIGMTYDEFLDTYCLPDNSSPGFLIVARYGIGSNRGLQDLQLVDTRVRGGGIDPDQLSEAKLAYPDISWMFDIGHYDGAPFPGSAATLIDLPASLLEINGGIFTRDQVDSIVKHHLSFGVYPVVRFYCTNTGLVSHETVPDETYEWNWTVPEGEKCPTPDGEVICQYEWLTTTTSTTSTTSSSTTTTSATASTSSSSTTTTATFTASTSTSTSSTSTTSSTTSTTSSTTSTSTTTTTTSSTSSTSSTSTTSSTASTSTSTSSSTTTSSSSSTTTTLPLSGYLYIADHLGAGVSDQKRWRIPRLDFSITLVADTYSHFGLAVSRTAGYYFVLEDSNLMRYDLAGISGVEIADNIDTRSGICIDESNSLLYYLSWSDGKVWKCNYTGTVHVALSSDLDFTDHRGIGCDPDHDKIFLFAEDATNDKQGIWSVDLDGTNLTEQIVTTYSAVNRVRGPSMDYDNDYMYYGKITSGSLDIRRCDLDGACSNDTSINNSLVTGDVFFAGHVDIQDDFLFFWMDKDNQKISRMSTNGSGHVEIGPEYSTGEINYPSLDLYSAAGFTTTSTTTSTSSSTTTTSTP